MPITGFQSTIVKPTAYRRVDPEVVASSTDWVELGSWFVERPFSDTWWAAISVVAVADPGVEGELRFVLSEADDTSEVARIVGWVGPVLLGWEEVTTWGTPEEQFISLQGRRTVGPGGGVRVLRSSATAMTAPPLSQRPGPNYPPGYDPGEAAPYPADYEVTDPYGG